MTRRRRTRKGQAKTKLAVASQRGPYLSVVHPTRGAEKEGMTRARKMRPAPVEVQLKVRLTKSGRTESKEVRSAACTEQPQRAVRRRRDFNRVTTGGRLWVNRAKGRFCCGERCFSAVLLVSETFLS